MDRLIELAAKLVGTALICYGMAHFTLWLTGALIGN